MLVAKTWTCRLDTIIMYKICHILARQRRPPTISNVEEKFSLGAVRLLGFQCNGLEKNFCGHICSSGTGGWNYKVLFFEFFASRHPYIFRIYSKFQLWSLEFQFLIIGFYLWRKRYVDMLADFIGHNCSYVVDLW